MVRPANGSLRDATNNAAVSTDDVDLGWDDIPASTTAPPPPAEGASQKVSEIRALSPSPEDSDFRRHQVSPAVIISAMAAAVALLVASVVSSQFPRVAAPSPEVVVTQTPKAPLAQPLPEPQSPTPAPSATVTTSAGPSASSHENPVETARPNAVTVTVKVIPENAVIFRAGKKLGTGATEVSVAHDTKERLTAFHDGYIPSNFTLDGSRATVTVRLQRVPSPQASASDASDSPFEPPRPQGEM